VQDSFDNWSPHLDDSHIARLVKELTARAAAHEADLERQWNAPPGADNDGVIRVREQKRYQKDPKNAEAIKRATTLLRTNLTPEQRATFDQKGIFYLYTQSGKKYRIEKGYAHNVKLVDETDKVLTTYCAHPAEILPDEDAMLAQKLALETDEAGFLGVANAS
jgi:hypothetical protein